MSTMKETETVFTPEVMAELQQLADAARGIRDPERMRQAAERARMREETYRKSPCDGR